MDEPAISAADLIAAGVRPGYADHLAAQINTLSPLLRDRYAATVANFYRQYGSQGYDLDINQAARTAAAQRAIRATGVKSASPRNTWHIGGAAADFTIFHNGKRDSGRSGTNAYQTMLAPIAKAAGLVNPIRGDVGHFQPVEVPLARRGRDVADFIDPNAKTYANLWGREPLVGQAQDVTVASLATEPTASKFGAIPLPVPAAMPLAYADAPRRLPAVMQGQPGDMPPAPYGADRFVRAAAQNDPAGIQSAKDYMQAQMMRDLGIPPGAFASVDRTRLAAAQAKVNDYVRSQPPDTLITIAANSQSNPRLFQALPDGQRKDIQTALDGVTTAAGVGAQVGTQISNAVSGAAKWMRSGFGFNQPTAVADTSFTAPARLPAVMRDTSQPSPMSVAALAPLSDAARRFALPDQRGVMLGDPKPTDSLTRPWATDIKQPQKQADADPFGYMFDRKPAPVGPQIGLQKKTQPLDITVGAPPRKVRAPQVAQVAPAPSIMGIQKTLQSFGVPINDLGSGMNNVFAAMSGPAGTTAHSSNVPDSVQGHTVISLGNGQFVTSYTMNGHQVSYVTNADGNTAWNLGGSNNSHSDSPHSGTVLCSYYMRKGWLSRELWEADTAFAKTLPRRVRRNYLRWARPTVRRLQRGAPILELVLWPIVNAWAHYAAWRLGAVTRFPVMGWVVHQVGSRVRA